MVELSRGAAIAAGAGVGAALLLAIASRVAAGHGGQVLVASTEGVGSTFTLRLPTGRMDAPPSPAAAAAASAEVP